MTLQRPSTHLFLLLLYLCLGLSPSTSSSSRPLCLGFDFGTSGVRSCVISSIDASIVHEKAFLWRDLAPASSSTTSSVSPGEDASIWVRGLHSCLSSIPQDVIRSIRRIAVSGTSATALLYDTSARRVSRGPLMYDHSVLSGRTPIEGARAVSLISASSPSGGAVNAASSTLAKLLTWHLSSPLSPSEILLHQADYIAMNLLASEEPWGGDTRGVSDWNNCLKLGFDVRALEYPSWLIQLLRDSGVSPMQTILPRVVEPGAEVGRIGSVLRTRFGLAEDCCVVGGTTDSIAAFLASGANETGQAVSSLGSTLAVKLLSAVPVEDSAKGVYSHRICGDKWLVGGASNVGGRVLRQEGFSATELQELSRAIDPSKDIDLDYYPLCKPGERFPIYDPMKQPGLTPRPALRSEYLHGILQGISSVECAAYGALEELGASPLREVLTSGGGANNEVWTAMRARRLGVRTVAANNSDAAFGAALLANLYT